MQINENTIILNEVLSIVYNSQRKIPAHFTSNNDRSQTFSVNFDELSPDDDLNMASESWYSISEYIKKDDSIKDGVYSALLKTGEDIMLSSFIFNKLGYKDDSVFLNIKNEIISNSLEDFEKAFPEFRILLNADEVINYFNHCEEFGKNVANK